MVLSYKCCSVEILVVVIVAIEEHELVFCLCKEYVLSNSPGCCPDGENFRPLHERRNSFCHHWTLPVGHLSIPHIVGLFESVGSSGIRFPILNWHHCALITGMLRDLG